MEQRGLHALTVTIIQDVNVFFIDNHAGIIAIELSTTATNRSLILHATSLDVSTLTEPFAMPSMNILIMAPEINVP